MAYAYGIVPCLHIRTQPLHKLSYIFWNLKIEFLFNFFFFVFMIISFDMQEAN
jgi:hypothetical protein